MHLKSDTLLLTDIFKNFGKMCLKIYNLDAAKFKKDWSKIRIMNWYWYITQFINMQKLTINIWKIMIKIKNRHISKYWDVNNLCSWAMVEWIEDTSQFNKNFIKSNKKKVMKDIFSKLTFNMLKNKHDFHDDLPFLPERMKTEKLEKLVNNLHEKNWVCYSHKKFKASNKSRISFEKKFIQWLNLIKNIG